MPAIRRSLLALTACLLFSFFTLRLWLASLKRPLWGDEVVGISGSIKNSFGQLLAHGPAGEASPSPLNYLIERGWLALWDFTPQHHWDLNLFFRILPVTYWALAGLAVFFFLYHLFKVFLPATPFGARLLIASGVATFYNSGDFGSYYALEDRSYALWTLLGTVHLGFFVLGTLRRLTKMQWAAYALISLLMVLTTYVALAQIALALFIQLASQRINGPRREPLWREALPYSATLLIATGVALNYFAKVGSWGFKPPSWQYFWECMGEVIAKAFHHHNLAPLAVTLPLLLVVMPWIFRHKPGVVELAALAWSYAGLGVLLFLACLWKGNLFASRYLIYLTPVFTGLYGMGILMLAGRLTSWLHKRAPRLQRYSYVSLLVIWAAVEIGQRIPMYTRNIAESIHILHTKNAYGPPPEGTDCPAVIDLSNERATFLFNERCRGRI